MILNRFKWGYVVILVFLGIATRTLLLNINSAEWGDSYRILRASNYVRNLTYPSDEKRPPLFSILLAIRPNTVDAVLWGRIFMLGMSLVSVYVFYRLSKKYLTTQRQRVLAVALLALNPVYLYWSLRIYADVPFSLLVMLCFYVFEVWREKLINANRASIVYPAAMGLLCGLGILTRFEGYLLTVATFTGILIVARNPLKRTLQTAGTFLLTLTVVVLPWLLYRNPLTSSYLEEPTGRKYGLEMLMTYLISFIFVLGIIPASALVVTHFFKKPSVHLIGMLKSYPHIVIFVALESLLILAWPAAIPRLFVPIIPFLIIAFVSTWQDKDKYVVTGGASIILTFGYLVAQNHLRLQFLGAHTLVFLLVGLMSFISALAILIKQRKLFLLSAIVSMALLAASTIYLHKNIYSSIKEISVFSLREARGKIIHNDTASIVNWYFPESEYKNLDTKKYLTQAYLLENQISYIILTNEFDPNLEIDLKKRPYLELVKESKHTTGGKMFFTWLIKVKL